MLFGSVGRCLFTNLDQTFDRYLFKKGDVCRAPCWCESVILFVCVDGEDGSLFDLSGQT